MRQRSIALITFSWREAHVTGIGLTPRGPMVAEDIRDLQSRTGHDRRPLRRRLVFPALLGLLAGCDSRSSGLIDGRIMPVATCA